MKRPIIVLLIFYLSSICVPPCHSAELKLNPEDSQILVRELLRMYPESLSTTEYVAKLHEWADLLDRYNSKKLLNKNEMKVYLFMIYIADQRVKTHSNEEIAKRIVQKFEAQPNLFLSTLKKSPFFIESACEGIKRHYLTFGGIENIQNFTEKYKSLFIQELGPVLGNTCIFTMRID
jgi:hypothetical protein